MAHRRVHLQFSLRALLLGVTAFCILLGSVGLYVRWELVAELNLEQQGVKELAAIDGAVSKYERVEPTWIQFVLCPDRASAQRVVAIGMSDCRDGDRDYAVKVVRLMRKFPHLRFLFLHGTVKIEVDAPGSWLDEKAIKAAFPTVMIELSLG
jgi:hypothetical protein